MVARGRGEKQGGKKHGSHWGRGEKGEMNQKAQAEGIVRWGGVALP